MTKEEEDREERADKHRRALLSPGASRELLGQLAVQDRARDIRRRLMRAGVPEAEARSRAICEATVGLFGPTLHELRLAADTTKGATHVTPRAPKRASFPRRQYVRIGGGARSGK